MNLGTILVEEGDKRVGGERRQGRELYIIIIKRRQYT